MKKKLLASLLTVSMMLTMVTPVVAAPQEAPAANAASDVAVRAAEGPQADVSWYNDQEKTFTIDTAEELAGLAELVNAGNKFAGKTIILGDDIDLSVYTNWQPIGNNNQPFSGIFDGDGHIIKNLVINRPNNNQVGLFGGTGGGEVKNFTLENANVIGKNAVGTVAGYPGTSKYTNITVKDHIQVNGGAYVGGALGYNAYANITNVDVLGDATSYINAESGTNRTYVGGLVGFMGEGNQIVSDCNVKIDVTGSMCDVGGILGILHYGNTLKNCTYEGNLCVSKPDASDPDCREFGALVGTVMNGTTGATTTMIDCSATVPSAVWNDQDVTDRMTLSGPFYNDALGSDTVRLEGFVNGKPFYISNNAAKVGNTEYKTLADAIAKNDSGTITLLANINEEVEVSDAKNLTIDLNGKTLNLGSNGNLNIDNAFVTVQNGTVKGDVVLTASDNDVAYNSFTLAQDATLEGYYGVIVLQKNVGADNYGTTVNIDGHITGQDSTLCVVGNIHTDLATAQHPVVVHIGSNAVMTNTTDGVSSVQIVGACDVTIEEGAQITGSTGVEVRAGNLLVNGGVITGNGSPSDASSNGTAAVGSGIAVAQQPANLPINVVVEGGTITGHTGFYVGNPENGANVDQVKATINGGNFNGKGGNAILKDTAAAAGALLVNGGYFTSNPADYVADDKAAVAETKVIDGVTYYYTVGEKQVVDVDTSVHAEDAVVNVPQEAVDAGISVENVIEAAKSSEKTLEGAAVNVANDPAVIDKEEAVAALEKAGAQDVTDIEVIVKPYIDVTIAAVSEDFVAVDIEAYYDLEATDGKGTTAVLSEKQPLKVTTPMTISIPLPNQFNATDAKAYVKHEKSNGRTYIYTGTVKDDMVTFTNPHGFSTFVVTPHNTSVAEIGGVGYPSLQAAVDDVQNGQTIVLKENNLSAEVNKEVKFTVDGATMYTANITAGNGFELSEENGIYTVTKSTGGGTVVKRYDITLLDAENGALTATHKRASKGSTVTLTATPDEGYVVDEVIVTDKDGDKVAVTKKDDNKYTFKMPASDVTLKATFKAEQTEPTDLPFTDVAKDAWYFPAVEYVFANGLMNGTGATTFAPNADLNRAMMAAVLYNMEGSPDCDKSGIFSDVADGKWYTDAINWAASNNIVSGMPDGTYAPNQALTREQMASVLYRYAEYKGIDVSARADLGTFTDGNSVSPWAQDVVQWAVAEKLISGNGKELQPKGTASRAQVATVLMNYCETVAK